MYNESATNHPADLSEILNPAKTRRTPSTPVTSRPPNEPADDSNPALFPTGHDLPGTNPDPSREARLLSPIQTSTTPTEADQAQRHGAERLKQVILRNRTYADVAEQRRKEAETKHLAKLRRNAMEAQSTRLFQDGDVYAPHDLSPAEMVKNRNARTVRPRSLGPLNSRKRGWRDVLDDLGIDPLKEYKNFTMMSEYMTDMGKIKHGRITGLRAVNQRRMAKAVRRSIGLGLMPSVHRHPELFEERLTKRGQNGMLASRPAWSQF